MSTTTTTTTTAADDETKMHPAVKTTTITLHPTSIASHYCLLATTSTYPDPDDDGYDNGGAPVVVGYIIGFSPAADAVCI